MPAAELRLEDPRLGQLLFGTDDPYEHLGPLGSAAPGRCLWRVRDSAWRQVTWGGIDQQVAAGEALHAAWKHMTDLAVGKGYEPPKAQLRVPRALRLEDDSSPVVQLVLSWELVRHKPLSEPQWLAVPDLLAQAMLSAKAAAEEEKACIAQLTRRALACGISRCFEGVVHSRKIKLTVWLEHRFLAALFCAPPYHEAGRGESGASRWLRRDAPPSWRAMDNDVPAVAGLQKAWSDVERILTGKGYEVGEPNLRLPEERQCAAGVREPTSGIQICFSFGIPRIESGPSVLWAQPDAG